MFRPVFEPPPDNIDPVSTRHIAIICYVTSGAIAVLLGATTVLTPVVAAFVAPAIICLFAVAWAARLFAAAPGVRARQHMVTLTFVVFVGHVAISLVINSSTLLISTLAPDALGYHVLSAEIANAWHHEGSDAGVPVPVGKEGFIYGLAALYWLLGPYAVSGLVVNSAFSAALLPVCYDTTRRLFGPETAKIVVIMLAVLPGFVIWSSQLLREASIIFFLAVVANAVVRLTERVTPTSICVLATSLVILFSLRANVALMVLCGALIGLSLGLRNAGKGMLIGSAAVAVLAGLMVLAGLGNRGLFASLGGDLEQVHLYRQALGAGAGSAINPNADLSSPTSALAFLPSAVADFLLGPFPWQVKKLFQATGLVDAFAFWVLVPSLYRGLRIGTRDVGRRLWTLLCPASLLLIMLSLLISNYGMILRQRPQVLVFVLPIIAHGWATRRRKRGLDGDDGRGVDRAVDDSGRGLQQSAGRDRCRATCLTTSKD